MPRPGWVRQAAPADVRVNVLPGEEAFLQISITERHTAVTDAVKDYAAEKANKLVKYYDRISAIEVILDGAQDQGTVEIIVKAEGTDDFVARVSNGDFLAGIDVVVSKLERQITKHKERHRNRKHMSKNPDKQI